MKNDAIYSLFMDNKFIKSFKYRKCFFNLKRKLFESHLDSVFLMEIKRGNISSLFII